MNVQCEPSKVKQTKPRAYIVRFVFGGLITALSGYLTTKFGVAVGGSSSASPPSCRRVSRW